MCAPLTSSSDSAEADVKLPLVCCPLPVSRCTPQLAVNHRVHLVLQLLASCVIKISFTSFGVFFSLFSLVYAARL